MSDIDPTIFPWVMRKLGIQRVVYSVGMITILSAVVWFVPTDPSLALSFTTQAV